jgi:hypothetical protein
VFPSAANKIRIGLITVPYEYNDGWGTVEEDHTYGLFLDLHPNLAEGTWNQLLLVLHDLQGGGDIVMDVIPRGLGQFLDYHAAMDTSYV